MATPIAHRRSFRPPIAKGTPRGAGIARLIRRRPLVCYFALAYAFAWGWWLPLAFAHRIVVVGMTPTHFPGLLGPLLAAFIVTGVTRGRDGIVDLLARMIRWRVRARWYLAALSPLAFFAIAAALARATGGDWPDLAGLGMFGGLPEIGVVGVWAAMILVNGFGEETGWRGFAIPRLQRAHGALASSLILAVVWALWHLPLFFILETYRGLGVAVIPGFFLGLACGAVVLTWLYNRSGGSILIVALWHGTYNMASGTVAARGVVAAIVSTLVSVQAIALVALDLRARRRGERSPLGPPQA